MTQYQQVSNSVDTVTSVSWKVCNECGSTFLQASERYNEPNATEAKRNETKRGHKTSSVFLFLLLRFETFRSGFRVIIQESV
jgi:hypothetical protein